MNLKLLESLIDSYCLIPDNEYLGIQKFLLRKISQSDGNPPKWAIINGSSCLDKKAKLFVIQGLPSSRSEQFLKDCRFDTVEEALTAFKEFIDNPRVPRFHYSVEAVEYVKANFPYNLYT